MTETVEANADEAAENAQPAGGQIRVERGDKGEARVTVSLEGSAFLYVFTYVRDSERGGELVCPAVSIELARDAHPVLVTAPVVREFANRYELLERHAHGAAEMIFGATPRPSSRPARTRRELTPEFLREMARRHEEHRNAGRPATQTLAREERVAPTTVKYWMRKAKELS